MEMITICGNLGADATVETYGNDTVVRFRVACNRNYFNRAGERMERTTWYSCSYWNVNPNIARIMLKGRSIIVVGTPDNRVYQNQNDMQWYVSNDIRVNYSQMVGPNPNHQTNNVLGIPQDAAVVNQPSSVQPSVYHREQMQASPESAGPTVITLDPEQPQQPSLFPNAAPTLPEAAPVPSTPVTTPAETEQPVHAELPY